MIICIEGSLMYLHCLNRPFNVRLENPHVIGPDQIWVGVISTGPSGRALNSSYRMRDTSDYKADLGNTIGKNREM
jgi:regulator of telomere elongation helicase 1